MPSSTKKPSPPADQRKSISVKSSLIVKLVVSPEKLRQTLKLDDPKKEESPVPKETKDSPATSATIPAAPASNNTENASDSNPNTPAAAGTPAPQPAPMGPPLEGPKKKGVKRGAGATNGNGEPKARGKPGPKKKQKLEDGTADLGRTNGVGAAHKLGPKANQGAINAGLRALDRSGKPCRKWTKGGFQLKSFTGVSWEIPRWTAPPKPKPELSTEDSATASAEDNSNKENKDNSQNKSDNSNNGGDVEMMQSTPASVNANSPAPIPVAVA